MNIFVFAKIDKSVYDGGTWNNHNIIVIKKIMERDIKVRAMVRIQRAQGDGKSIYSTEQL